MKIKEVTSFLEELAPLNYQEDYDNSGLIIGDAESELKGVLVSLDVTEEVIQEAINKGCNLIVAHHPLIFKGLKKLNGKNYVERSVILAIKNDIAIYAIHTNLDNIAQGVNYKIAEKIGLKDVRILRQKKNTLLKLTVFVPINHTANLLEALHKAGAGNIGNYDNCSFMSQGRGRFTPNDGANPAVGTSGIAEEVEENRIEVILPANLKSSVLRAMQSAHPYEEVAYYLQTLENANQEVGSGAIGLLPSEMTETEFLGHLKESMSLQVIRYTAVNKKIRKVAVCGGVGSFLLKDALSQGADAFVTADYKYHEFFDAEGSLLIADIGHFESEVFTKELLVELLSKKITNFAPHLSEVKTNPVNYYY
jgi:dinuclear metal center YbgI/SA1388 family protein